MNDNKIYNKRPHMSCCLIQKFRPSGFFNELQNQNLDKEYTIWNSYLYIFEVKTRLRNTLNKSKTYTSGKIKNETVKNNKR